MKIPNAQKAVIAPDKLRDYLLNSEHKRGGPKAQLLLSMGYRSDNWSRLEQDLRLGHLTAEISRTTQNPYGTRYEIVAPIRTPSGREIPFRSIWQIDTGTDTPRLITMYPE